MLSLIAALMLHTNLHSVGNSKQVKARVTRPQLNGNARSDNLQRRVMWRQQKAGPAYCTQGTRRQKAHLDVCVEEQLIGAIGKPQSLNVLDGLDVIQHHVGRNEVDSETQSCPP